MRLIISTTIIASASTILGVALTLIVNYFSARAAHKEQMQKLKLEMGLRAKLDAYEKFLQYQSQIITDSESICADLDGFNKAAISAWLHSNPMTRHSILQLQMTAKIIEQILKDGRTPSQEIALELGEKNSMAMNEIRKEWAQYSAAIEISRKK